MFIILKADLSVRLRRPDGPPTEICELVGEEFCHHNDLCLLLEPYKNASHCPESFKKFGNDCSCPIKKVRS